MKEVVRDNLPIHVVLWSTFLQYAEGLGEVLIERDRLMSELAYQQVLLLHFFFER
jgi:hypothetical protein